jgi:hypothetical protein
VSPDEIKTILPDEPADGYVVEYWLVDNVESKRPIRYICRYDVNTAWKNHPWGKADRGPSGAPFKDEWSIWVEDTPGFPNPGGRIDGWNTLEGYLVKDRSYCSLESANRHLVLMKKERIEDLKSQIKRLQSDIDRISVGSTS